MPKRNKQKKEGMPKTKNEIAIIPSEIITNKIYIIRGHKVMIDRDLAELYGVQTKVLNQAVRRNKKRFPDDFMWELTKDEQNFLRSQFVTLKTGRGHHVKYRPYAFTEQGVAMLSSVLKSERAILVNIQIMRTFTKLRGLLVTNEQLRKKIEKLESKYDQHFRVVFEAIRKLVEDDVKPKKQIGFS